jgi:hypothetical protein
MIRRGARGLFAWQFVLTLLGVALMLANGTARAQDLQSGNFRLVAIKFAGLKKFTEAQGIAGSGLRIGDGITTTQLSVAANQLAKSGAFDEVAFQYSTRGNELTAVFTVVESKHLLPCIFDNFVWFSYDQVDKAVRARVPFYSGVAPLSGATQQQIVDALRALLESSGVTANVQGIPSGAAGGIPTAMLFRVLGVSMPVKTVNSPGFISYIGKRTRGGRDRGYRPGFLNFKHECVRGRYSGAFVPRERVFARGLRSTAMGSDRQSTRGFSPGHCAYTASQRRFSVLLG